MQRTIPKTEIKPSVLIEVCQWKSVQMGVAVVYKLTFTSGKYYIGSTSDLRKRMQVFNSNFLRKKYTIKRLTAESRISVTCFIEILEVVNDRSVLLEREDFFIKQLNGDGILNRSKSSYSNNGIKWTDEEKKAISAGRMGQKPNEATRKKMSEAKKNVIVSPKTRKKISVSLKKGAAVTPNKMQVSKYTLDGKFIQTYPSIKIAALRARCAISTLSKKIREDKSRPHRGFIYRAHNPAISELRG